MESAYCRTEERRTRWQFSGYATMDAHENTVRPRASYISCRSCSLLTLRLADLFDAEGLCFAVEKEWRRYSLGRLVQSSSSNAPGQSPGIRYDTENLLGQLYEHLWKLYTKWDPARLTFTSYATGILRKKINTFIAADLGDAAGNRVNPKAHSRSVCGSLDELTTSADGEHRLVFAYGRGAMDADAGGLTATGWLGTVGHSPPSAGAVRGAGQASGSVEA